MQDVLWAGAAAGANRSGAEQGVPVAVRRRGDEHPAAPAVAAVAADRCGRVAGGSSAWTEDSEAKLRFDSRRVPGAAERPGSSDDDDACCVPSV